MNSILYIGGPAHGSMAFAFPGSKRVEDDTLFLSSSDYELARGEVVFRMSRSRAASGARVRVGAFKQILEAGLDRPGHSFCAIFEFVESAPHGTVIAQTLIELISEIERVCCSSRGHFCDYDTFRRFLESEIEPSYEGIVEQLSQGGLQPFVQPLSSPIAQPGRLYVGTDFRSVDGVGRVVDWFTLNPASVTTEMVISGGESGGKAGKTLRKVESLVEVETEVVHSLYAASLKLEGSLARLTEKCNEIDSALEIARRDAQRCQSEILTREEELNIYQERYAVLQRTLTQTEELLTRAMRRTSPQSPPTVTSPSLQRTGLFGGQTMGAGLRSGMDQVPMTRSNAADVGPTVTRESLKQHVLPAHGRSASHPPAMHRSSSTTPNRPPVHPGFVREEELLDEQDTGRSFELAYVLSAGAIVLIFLAALAYYLLFSKSVPAENSPPSVSQQQVR